MFVCVALSVYRCAENREKTSERERELCRGKEDAESETYGGDGPLNVFT